MRDEELPDSIKNEILHAEKKSNLYTPIYQRRQLGRAANQRAEFHSYILKNGIFFLDDIRKQFLDINQMMIEAQIEREMSLNTEGTGQPFVKFEKATKLESEGRPLLDKLQGEIHDRLWVSTRSS